MSAFSRLTTKDVLAVMVVGSVLVFNGISMLTGSALDAGTIGMAGVIVGHYFGPKAGPDPAPEPEELPEPFTGGDDN